jgi:hypothetical protein
VWYMLSRKNYLLIQIPRCGILSQIYLDPWNDFFEKDLYLKPEDQRTFQEMIERDGYMIYYEVDFGQKDGKRIYFNDYEK